MRGLLIVLSVFLAVDAFVYFAASAMFRTYQASATTSVDKRIDALAQRLDAIEQKMQAVNTDVAKAATASAAAAKQSQSAADEVNKLAQTLRNSRQRTKK